MATLKDAEQHATHRIQKHWFSILTYRKARKMSKDKQLTPIELGRLAYQLKVKNGEIKRLTPIEKAKENPKSMRLAINANCYDCMGRENWIVRTKFCILFHCPFWTMRKGNKGITKEMCKTHETN
jgi:hypothetical protein